MSNGKNVVHLPTQDDVEAAKVSSRALTQFADYERVNMSLTADGQTSEDLILPGHILDILLNVLSEMAKGNAISLMPIHHELSTQDAANILNVSRPYLVGLLERKEIPHHKVGSHRRVLAQDVINYKQKIDEERVKTLNELTALSQEEGMGYEI